MAIPTVKLAAFLGEAETSLRASSCLWPARASARNQNRKTWVQHPIPVGVEVKMVARS